MHGVRIQIYPGFWHVCEYANKSLRKLDATFVTSTKILSIAFSFSSFDCALTRLDFAPT
jgi:hypothetical protein